MEGCDCYVEAPESGERVLMIEEEIIIIYQNTNKSRNRAHRRIN